MRTIHNQMLQASLLFVLLLHPGCDWIDLNGDTSGSAVFANFGQANQVCVEDGASGFRCTDVSADANVSFGVTIEDMNGDGTLDAAFANDGRNRMPSPDFLNEFKPLAQRHPAGMALA